MENQQCIQEDEIDIREYINVIIKRKKLILVIFLVSVVTAAIVSLRAPKIYEITSTIQLGNVNGTIIGSEEVKAIMLNQNSLFSIINDLNLKTTPESFQKNIKISDMAGTNLLKLKITYSDVDAALKINDGIVNPFIAQGQAKFRERLATVNERLKELGDEIKSSETDIARTQALISELPNASGVSQSDLSLRIVLLQNTLPAYESNLTVLRNQRNALKLVVIGAKDFKVFDAPIKPAHSVGSKKKQNVLIAGMLSLMFGVFLVFVLEFWQKSKK